MHYEVLVSLPDGFFIQIKVRNVCVRLFSGLSTFGKPSQSQHKWFVNVDDLIQNDFDAVHSFADTHTHSMNTVDYDFDIITIHSAVFETISSPLGLWTVTLWFPSFARLLHIIMKVCNVNRCDGGRKKHNLLLWWFILNQHRFALDEKVDWKYQGGRLHVYNIPIIIHSPKPLSVEHGRHYSIFISLDLMLIRLSCSPSPRLQHYLICLRIVKIIINFELIDANLNYIFLRIGEKMDLK